MGCICAADRSEKSSLLLQNLTYLKSISRRCASKYYEHGMRYHRLPLHIRNHEAIQDSWRNYCTTAFTVSANRELPDLIQLLAMLEIKFQAVHSAPFKGEVNAAERNLFVAQKLVLEAHHRVNTLQWAVVQYERLVKLVGDMDVAVGQDQDKKSMEVAWKMVLPASCGKSTLVCGK